MLIRTRIYEIFRDDFSEREKKKIETNRKAHKQIIIDKEIKGEPNISSRFIAGNLQL